MISDSEIANWRAINDLAESGPGVCTFGALRVQYLDSTCCARARRQKKKQSKNVVQTRETRVFATRCACVFINEHARLFIVLLC